MPSETTGLDVPETGDLSRLRPILRCIRTALDPCVESGLSRRQIAYVLQTDRCLGMLNDEGGLASIGLSFLEQSSGSEAEKKGY